MSEYVFKKEAVVKIGFKNFPLGWYSDDLAVLEFSNFKNVYSLNNSLVFIRFSALSISGNSSYSRKNLILDLILLLSFVKKEDKFFETSKAGFIFETIKMLYKRKEAV